MQKQFDYDYAVGELQALVEGPIARMAARSRRGVIFFNNHVRAQAPKNAAELIRILRREEFGVVS
jgi:uncharacterized protein YecE (DUF72 family)